MGSAVKSSRAVSKGCTYQALPPAFAPSIDAAAVGANVRGGSKADLTLGANDVGFYLNNRHGMRQSIVMEQQVCFTPDSVAKLVLQAVSKILRAVGGFFV